MFYIVGLGNPGEEYQNSRHNTGRILVENFRKSQKFPDWENDKKAKGLISKGKIEKEKIVLLLPETFMNKSGDSVSYFIKPPSSSAKASAGKKKIAEKLVVVYDDIDLPLGKIKISFNRGSGGHRGLESIVRKIKTKEFVRLRVGVSGKGAKGRARKPNGEDAVVKFILGKFKPTEITEFKKMSKEANEALYKIVTEGKEKAMGTYNSG